MSEVSFFTSNCSRGIEIDAAGEAEADCVGTAGEELLRAAAASTELPAPIYYRRAT